MSGPRTTRNLLRAPIAFADGANSDAQAVGLGDIASVINTGSGFDQAISGGTAPFSDNDLALVIGAHSTAVAGNGGDWGIAAVFGDILHASAPGANFVLDILPSLEGRLFAAALDRPDRAELVCRTA